ncbi:MAG: UvrD-helicase domain-containing protein, partial [Deltaproteobacteria bacterium]|nr:UvrD-helicase domain-containing protein [Deltaproteobacteria bacterium]
ELRQLLALWRESGTIAGLEDLLWSCAQRRGRIVPGYDRAQLDRIVAGLGQRSSAERFLPLVHGRARPNVALALDAVFAALESFKADPALLASFRKLREVYDGVTALSSQPPALDYARTHLEKASAKSPELAAFAQDLMALDEAIPKPQALVVDSFSPKVAARLADLKRAQGRFDFQDMLALVNEALAGPRGPALVAALRARFTHALIDEFQDTDEVQWSIFRRVFFESPDHRLFLVGDPKQAIYAFRGADVHTYLDARREVVARSGPPAVLADNFRSTAPLLAACEQLFQDGFFTGEIGFTPVGCGRKELAFVDPAGRAPVHVFVTGSDSSGKQKVYPRLGPAIAGEIRRLVDPPTPARFKGEQLRYRDVFILARGAADLGLVANHLREAGVPFSFYKQEGLFQSAEAQAVEDLLAAVADPSDRARRYRAWMTPFFGLALAEAVRAAEVAEDDPLVRRLHDWNRLATGRHHEKLFDALLEDSGLVRRLVLFEPGERSLTNYLHILEVLREQHVMRGASVEEMVQDLRAFRQKTRQPPGQNGNLQRLETERDAVQLLTMHMSKGLEAPVVFLVGGYNKPPRSDGLRTLHWPPAGPDRERLNLLGGTPRRLAAQADLEDAEEDQRLLYVALTRAQGRLYLPFVGTREGQGAQRVFEGPRKKKMTGPYAQVNSRLERILAGAPEPSQLPRPDALFSYELLGEPGCHEASSDAGATGAADAPPRIEPGAVALLQIPPSADLAPLRRRHAGFLTTSFTGLRDRMESPAADEKSESHDVTPPGEDELPGGAASGSFLHELLARIPQQIAARCRTPEALFAAPEVARLVKLWAGRWGIAERYLPHAGRLVHAALTTPIALGEGRSIGGIARADKLLREMDFLYPIPEQSHPRLDQRLAREEGGRPLEIRRGFVVGFVDVLFEHQGLTYFADWKSNCLAGFDAQHVGDEVRKVYALQAEIYTLALVKMLGIAGEQAYRSRFGGLLFLFLRGLKPDGEGVYFRRPSWSEVLGWERRLLELDLSSGGVA